MAASAGSAAAGDTSRLLTVSDLVNSCRSLVERGWPVAVRVAGELSNVRQYPSGHTYFTLKDTGAEVSCIMFARDLHANSRGIFPDDGDRVEAAARPTVYEPKGRLQLKVTRIAKQGVGDIHARFVETKKRLRAEGWFDPGRKRPLPRWPQAVGVVASPDGAAWRDVKTTLAKRFPNALVLLFSAPAQGAEAAGKIAAAIRSAGAGDCDTLIVCRGGGSLEDLWSYNEVEVAQAILDSPVPVVTGIGHETDETIADYVADLRAPTPTGAAVAAVPSRSELLAQLAGQAARLLSAVGREADAAAQRADEAGSGLRAAGSRLAEVSGLRVQATAIGLTRAGRQLGGSASGQLGQASSALLLQQRLLAQAAVSLRRLGPNLSAAAGRSVARKESRLDGAATVLGEAALRRRRNAGNMLAALRARLDSASPQRVLERGYAMVEKTDGSSGATYVQRASGLRAGDRTRLIFADGCAAAQIASVDLEQGFAPAGSKGS